MTVLEGKALLEHGKAIAERYARRVGPEVAEELRGEAVLRALRSPPPDGRMEPWLERIYRNLFVDLWRRGQLVTAGRSPADLPDPNTPEEGALGRERRRIVRASLHRLPREARRALVARYYAELDDAGAALRFGVAPATVRTRIHRALARLRERLGDLRAWCPPLLGKLGATAAALGLAPALVATLAVVGASPAPPPIAQAAPSRAAAPQRVAAARPATHAEPVAGAAAARVRLVRRPALPATEIAPSSPPVARAPLAAEVAVVEDIQQPEAIDVFAEPGRPLAPCLVEAPADLSPQIIKMIDDRL
jgi:RNA polymerase sigma factor (sigma-70 family)